MRLGSSADGKGEEGIDRGFERASAPLYLGEKKSSLERGEQSDGEVIRVDAGRELPVGLKGSEPFADRGRPPFEPGSDQRSGLWVALGELTAERAEGAAALRLGALRLSDHHVPPGFDPFHAAEIRVPLVIDDGVGLVVDDRLHEIVLVGKVVVKLRAADFRRRLDDVQGGARDPALVDQAGGLLHYPRPGALALRGEPRPATRLVDHAPILATFWVWQPILACHIVSRPAHFQRTEETRG